MRSADLTNDTAHGGDEALADGQPEAEPGGQAPDTGCADGPHRPSTTDHTGATPQVHLAARADTSTPGEALPRDPPETSAGSEARETTPDTPQRADEGGTSPSRHNRDNDSFHAFMDSWSNDPRAVPAPEMPRVHSEPQRDQADDRALTVPRQAHLQRDYTTLRQIAATGEGQRTASSAADRTTDERNAPGEGTRVERPPTPRVSLSPHCRGPPLPWGRGHLDYARLEGDTGHPSEHAEQEATQDLSFWIPRLVTGEQLELAVQTRWALRGPATSRREHAPWQTSHLVIGQGTRPPPPWTAPTNGAMWPPGSWRIWEPTAQMK